MSDHVDGPRQIGDPPGDRNGSVRVHQPGKPGHTVLALNAFCSAGITAMFSNVVNHSIVVRAE